MVRSGQGKGRPEPALLRDGGKAQSPGREETTITNVTTSWLLKCCHLYLAFNRGLD